MKLKAPIKGIFLDVGWTLCKPLNGRWMLTNEFLSHVNMEEFNNLSKDRLDDVMKRSNKYLDNNHLIKTEEEELSQIEIYYQLIAKELPELELTKAATDAIAYDKVYNMENYPYYEDSIETVKLLSENYKLGILSDNWPSCERLLKHAGITDYFSAVTISSYLGVFKPHPLMYLDALQKIQLPPEQTIFVDDGIENLDGAALQGIQSVLITREEKLQELYIGQKKHVQINSLAELLNILP